MTIDWLQTLGWEPSVEIVRRFEKFFEILVAVNRSHNLTRITTLEAFWEKHVWDSLSGVQPWLSSERRSDWMEPLQAHDVSQVIDIGTGGGFPGLPVAIARPDWQVTLLDSTQKKVNSLKQFAETLACPVTPICDRAETLGQHPDFREQYDLALIRAVASPAVCSEYALPLVKMGGVVVLYRGRWLPEEETGLRKSLEVLGGELVKVHGFETPETCSDRHCIYLKKVTPTPEKYPRRVGVPVRKPLG